MLLSSLRTGMCQGSNLHTYDIHCNKGVQQWHCVFSDLLFKPRFTATCFQLKSVFIDVLPTKFPFLCRMKIIESLKMQIKKHILDMIYWVCEWARLQLVCVCLCANLYLCVSLCVTVCIWSLMFCVRAALASILPGPLPSFPSVSLFGGQLRHCLSVWDARSSSATQTPADRKSVV